MLHRDSALESLGEPLEVEGPAALGVDPVARCLPALAMAVEVAVLELEVPERPPLLRAYLTRWPTTASMFDGISKDSTDDELRRAAPGQPVFRLTERTREDSSL